MSPTELDLHRLAAYLAAVIPGFSGPLAATKFSGGQSNPTYLLETPGARYVLRRKPAGRLLPSAHAIEREYRVMRALAPSAVPVPAMRHLCTDPAIIGSPFFIMSYIAGRIFWDPILPGLSRQEVSAAYDAMNRVLADLHAVDYAGLGLADYGRPGNYYARQFSRWCTQYEASCTEPIPAMDALMAWLETHLPATADQTSLVHGDYRLDNLIFHPREPRILAVIDWELSTLGHPFADLAYQCMQWRMPVGNRLQGLKGIDRAKHGIPTEAEYIRRYCEYRGIEPPDHWDFYLAFSFFRLAAILQGVLKRARDGNASSAQALELGRLAYPLAEAGLAVAEGKAERAT